jgi:hypothetical protein
MAQQIPKENEKEKPKQQKILERNDKYEVISLKEFEGLPEAVRVEVDKENGGQSIKYNEWYAEDEIRYYIIEKKMSPKMMYISKQGKLTFNKSGWFYLSRQAHWDKTDVEEIGWNPVLGIAKIRATVHMETGIFSDMGYCDRTEKNGADRPNAHIYETATTRGIIRALIQGLNMTLPVKYDDVDETDVDTQLIAEKGIKKLKADQQANIEKAEKKKQTQNPNKGTLTGAGDNGNPKTNQ